MITGKDLIEKMYSENYDEYEDTRLYSTGDDELDDLLERAFCEGYEYAQREFGNRENKKAQREWKIQQAKKDKKLVELAKEHSRGGLTSYNSNQGGPTFIMADSGREYPYFKKGSEPFKLGDDEQLLREWRRKNDREELHRELEPNSVTNVDQSINYKSKGIGDKFGKFGGKGDNPSERMQDLKNNKRYKRNLKIDNKTNLGNFIKDHKGAIIGGTLGTAALVGGGIALHRKNKKKKEEEEKKSK